MHRKRSGKVDFGTNILNAYRSEYDVELCYKTKGKGNLISKRMLNIGKNVVSEIREKSRVECNRKNYNNNVKKNYDKTRRIIESNIKYTSFS